MFIQIKVPLTSFALVIWFIHLQITSVTHWKLLIQDYQAFKLDAWCADREFLEYSYYYRPILKYILILEFSLISSGIHYVRVGWFIIIRLNFVKHFLNMSLLGSTLAHMLWHWCSIIDLMNFPSPVGDDIWGFSSNICYNHNNLDAL